MCCSVLVSLTAWSGVLTSSFGGVVFGDNLEIEFEVDLGEFKRGNALIYIQIYARNCCLDQNPTRS